MAAPAPPRAYTAAHFGLELDSKRPVGFIRSIEGGGVSTELINYQYGDKYDIWRQLGRPKYEDFKIQCGMGMSFEFMAWIELFFEGKGPRKNGAILAADGQYIEQARREFADAMITEIAIPKLDGSDKGAAYATITIAPEKMTFMKGNGQKLPAAVGSWKGQQLWTACNFEFTIDGFEPHLLRCTKIDGFSIKQKPIDYPYGEAAGGLKIPGRIEWPNISFYIPKVDAKALIDEFAKYAGHTKQGLTDGGKTGSIVCQDAVKNELFSLNLTGMHIKSVTPDKGDAGSDEIKQVKFEVGVEKMEFDWPEKPM
jgi:hypothetical protein